MEEGAEQNKNVWKRRVWAGRDRTAAGVSKGEGRWRVRPAVVGGGVGSAKELGPHTDRSLSSSSSVKP